MSVGSPMTKAEIDNRTGYLVLELRRAFDDIKHFKSKLDTKTVNDLVALGYDESSAGEVSLLKSAFTDLDHLRQVFEGSATQATAYNFLTFGNLLTGVY